MRKLLTGYAIGFNGRHRRVGHLFQNRYKSILVEEEVYLLELVRYIHLNPLRARLVEDVRQLETYPWSGHFILLGNGHYAWQDCHYILTQFGKRIGKARKAYRDFVGEDIQQGRRSDLEGGGLVRSAGGWKEVVNMRRGREKWAYDERVLGGSDFVESLLREIEEKKDSQKMGKKMKVEELQGLIKEVELKLGLFENEVMGGSRRRRVIEARDIVSHIAVRRFGTSLKEVGEALRVSKQSVFRGIERGERKLKERGWKLSDIIM